MLAERLLPMSTPREDSMADSNPATATLLDDLAALELSHRRDVAKQLRKLSETAGEIPDGKTTSHVLGVLAHLLDPA
jgi:hypothetical protein